MPVITPIRYNSRREAALKDRLEATFRQYHYGYLDSDPLSLVRRYKSRADREAAALIVSAFAYGRADIIKNNIGSALEKMEGGPARYVRTFDPAEGRRRFADFSHRFHKTDDLVCLLDFMRQMIERAGSVGVFFQEGFDSEAPTLKEAMARFSQAALKLEARGGYGVRRLPDKAGVRYFFPSPEDGSACKRFCLFLRWMVRPDDGVDLGLWKFARPDQLAMPVDTHIARISGYIGLTRRQTISWKMSEEITAALRRIDPVDPVRFDFSLCRLGILDHCPRKRNPAKCAACPILDVCRLQ